VSGATRDADELPPFRLFGDDAADLGPGTWLLEASAGTGKTYTIVGIVLRLIAEAGVPIERCVVMTFTRAATAELRERIRTGLHAALGAVDAEEAPADPFLADFRRRHRGVSEVRRRLLLAIAGLDAALVATIHGICHRLLGDHALHARVPLGAELDADLARWRAQTVHDLLRDWTRRIPEDAGGLLGRSLDPEDLARDCERIERQPTVELDGVDAVDPAAIAAHLARARDAWPTWREEIAAFAARHAKKLGRTKGFRKKDLAGSLDRIGELLARSPARDKLDDLCTPYLEPNRKKSYLDDSELAELGDSGWHAGLRALLDVEAGARRALVAAYRERLFARPLHHHHLHFGDLLVALDRAMTGSAVEELRRAVAARYDVALVDEFQDTDPLQWRIFDGLFAGPGRRLFLIGDPKQAIYAFRGADVHAYLRVAADPKLRAATLDTNHRSDRELVAAVNRCFDRGPATFVVDGIRFRPVAAARDRRFHPPADCDPRPFQLWWQEPAASVVVTRRRIAAAVAAEIARLLAGGEREVDGRRVPLRERDVAVLVRSHAEGELIADALAALERPIPCVRNLRRSVFEGRTAYECHVLLAAVLAPHREPAMRAAALTRLGDLPAAALVDERGGGLARLSGRLRELHENWFDRGFPAMWQDLLERGCGRRPPRAALAAEPDGERAITDLLHVGDLLAEAEEHHGLAPEGLLGWLERAIADDRHGGADEQLLRLDRDDDAVGILTIHASKGLQFPVVFAPFLWSARDGDDEGIHHRDHVARWWFGAAPAEIVAARRRESLAESLRLAYVALTRAEHRCYAAFAPQPKARGSRGCAGSALAWLADGAERAAGDERLAAEDFAAATAESVSDPDWQDAVRRAFDHPAIAVVGPPGDATVPPPRAEPRTVDDRPVAQWRPRRRERWFSSYSGLVRDRPVDEPDHDQVRDDAPREDPLPHGARFGVALHAIFEHCDFDGDRDDLEATCRHHLRARGYGEDLTPAVADLVARTLDHPLPGTDVPLRRCARRSDPEFEVLLPVCDPGSLAAAFRAHGGAWTAYADDLVGIELRDGFFTGIVDLVFVHDGRAHLVDWKSNDLANRGGYGDEAMRAEMRRHHYVLQYHCYLLALHRHLALRIPDYDPARHLGDAHYLFVRGLDGDGAGWYRHRPADAMIRALDDCFGAAR